MAPVKWFLEHEWCSKARDFQKLKALQMEFKWDVVELLFFYMWGVVNGQRTEQSSTFSTFCTSVCLKISGGSALLNQYLGCSRTVKPEDINICWERLAWILILPCWSEKEVLGSGVGLESETCCAEQRVWCRMSLQLSRRSKDELLCPRAAPRSEQPACRALSLQHCPFP